AGGLPPQPAAVAAAAPATVTEPSDPAGPEPAPLTLADVAELGRDSDYSAFVGRGVAPDVRNAALKKLFTDPHYNVMDGLDTYIEDYGIPDPLPPGMLRQMTQTAFLGLFGTDDENAGQAEPLAQSDARAVTDATVIAAADPTQQPRTAAEPTPDEDPDLRLQPDDAAGRAEPGAGADEDPRRQR
ncbi:MAG: DUF3306 domain-containing protein, partial [Pseudomonadota bacterium]|nr:DUF3306 domain-containing protein [Pseudomonadota bacterium]